MVGGAEATGNPNDTAIVYTPAFHEYNEEGQCRVYVWNVTLPQHFLSRAPIDPDQSEPADSVTCTFLTATSTEPHVLQCHLGCPPITL